jgi:hypothetical protein
MRFLLALAIASPAAVAAQVSGSDQVEGYPISAMRDYWNVARDVQDQYSFESAHTDAIDALEEPRFVLSVHKGDEHGLISRIDLNAHCRRAEVQDRRLRDCRYRLVTSSLDRGAEVGFDAAGASGRLRAAGITPEAFGTLVRAVPLNKGIPEPLPEKWGEMRRVQLVLAAPLVEDFAKRLKTEIIDSTACPAMVKPLRRLVNLTFEPSRVPGLSDEPRHYPNVPHSPSFTFRVLAGSTFLEWNEGAAMSAAGRRILASIREIESDCR